MVVVSYTGSYEVIENKAGLWSLGSPLLNNEQLDNQTFVSQETKKQPVMSTALPDDNCGKMFSLPARLFFLSFLILFGEDPTTITQRHDELYAGVYYLKHLDFVVAVLRIHKDLSV